MLWALSGALGAAIFGAAGWLGVVISDVWYGSVQSEPDGPLPVKAPLWTFVVACACVGLSAGIRGASPLQMVILIVAVLSLTVCASTDCRTGMIPDLFTLGPLIVVLVFAAVRREWAPFFGVLFVCFPFAATAALSRGRGMGWGDVKLAALGGALLGMGGITLAVVAASICALVTAALQGRARRPIAFGPYLAVSIGGALGLASWI